VKLAMLSWRYDGHPQAGGAEIVTHEVLKRAVADGWDVTCFTAAYPDASDTDEIDGVRIVRRGQQWSVHAHAWRWLRPRLEHFDRVVDQVNTVPFLTPLYVPEAKRRLLIFQLAREYWWRETRGPFKLVAPIGYALEPWQFRLYRGTDTMTISSSSKEDLVAAGIPSRRVTILPMAVLTEPIEALEPKTHPPRVVIVGRLTPAKYVEEGIAAFADIQRRLPAAALDVVGAGDPRYRERLERLVADLGLRDVTFHGRIDEAGKRRVLERAQLHMFTSHREGWGLTVTEAAAVGTPTVGYDVPGVRDSIADARALAAERTAPALTERALALLTDADLYASVRARVWERARALCWGRTAEAFMEALR
jgi:glycosyltransferase involved in cell wall biosynthesis